MPLLARRLRGVYDDAILLAQLLEGVQQDNDDAVHLYEDVHEDNIEVEHKEEGVHVCFFVFLLFFLSSRAFCLASSSLGSSRREYLFSFMKFSRTV